MKILSVRDYSVSFDCRTKKLFEFPVASDFAKEKAFNAAQ
ncbi:hypothetical protein GCM10007887_42890 [Methylobacterium haplocladii]|uniref:Uncharacterized protein n=1 Tax=Methylobacterium brachythecii TaxID=1176177 RepID=A0ABQ6DBY1_9HYPH|nr:hypothetical protein GCM10007884_51190 [Methylobacterium brachythecii]GLS61563.1 hypothetical protein GCM10007887_42890 [Methylobacterium haplocladii]